MPVIYLLPCVSITNCKVSFLTFMVVDGTIWNLMPNKQVPFAICKRSHCK